jgi:hypothetical protein
VKAGDARGALGLIALVTKAVVATFVLLSPDAGVGAVVALRKFTPDVVKAATSTALQVTPKFPS